jgi:hypothetical protein
MKKTEVIINSTESDAVAKINKLIDDASGMPVSIGFGRLGLDVLEGYYGPLDIPENVYVSMGEDFAKAFRSLNIRDTSVDQLKKRSKSIMDSLRRNGLNVWVNHIRPSVEGVKQQKGGQTKVAIFRGNELLSVGHSVCVPEDNFCRPVALYIALVRAYYHYRLHDDYGVFYEMVSDVVKKSTPSKCA